MEILLEYLSKLAKYDISSHSIFILLFYQVINIVFVLNDLSIKFLFFWKTSWTFSYRLIISFIHLELKNKQFAMGHPVDGCLAVFGWVDGAIHHPFTLARSKIPFPQSFYREFIAKKRSDFHFCNHLHDTLLGSGSEWPKE